MMALFATMVLMVVATEVMYQTTVEAKVSSQAVNQVKAYYAAKSAVELGLFRVHIFRKVSAQFGSQLPDKSMLDLIWSFPFAWPPPLPEEMSTVSKDQIESAVKESLMKDSYNLSIQSEGSKIDINDLISPSRVIAASTRRQLFQIFETHMRDNPDAAEEFRQVDVNRLVNNIVDWIDEDSESLNGGDERAFYREANSEAIPPNQPLKTLGELHMIDGMTDEIFDLIAPRLTIFGTKGINVNYANKDVLMSIDPGITAEIADRIIERRNDPQRGGLFKDINDFTGFLERELGVSASNFVEGTQVKVPLVFDLEQNFRIIGSGKAGPVIREIVAVTYDRENIQNRLSETLKKQAAADQGASAPTGNQPPGTQPDSQPGRTTPPAQNSNIQVPKGRPNVVYWGE